MKAPVVLPDGNRTEQLDSVQPFLCCATVSAKVLTKAPTTTTAKYPLPLRCFQTNDRSLIKIRATPFLSFVFTFTANGKCTIEQWRQAFHETHTAYRLALIHSTYGSSLQSEL